MEQLNQMASGGFDLSAMAGSSSAELIQAQMDLAQLKFRKPRWKLSRTTPFPAPIS